MTAIDESLICRMMVQVVLLSRKNVNEIMLNRLYVTIYKYAVSLLLH